MVTLGNCVAAGKIDENDNENQAAQNPRCLQRENHAAILPFASNEHALVVAEVAEFVQLDFVLLGFGVVHVAFAGAESP